MHHPTAQLPTCPATLACNSTGPIHNRLPAPHGTAPAPPGSATCTTALILPSNTNTLRDVSTATIAYHAPPPATTGDCSTFHAACSAASSGLRGNDSYTTTSPASGTSPALIASSWSSPEGSGAAPAMSRSGGNPAMLRSGGNPASVWGGARCGAAGSMNGRVPRLRWFEAAKNAAPNPGGSLWFGSTWEVVGRGGDLSNKSDGTVLGEMGRRMV